MLLISKGYDYIPNKPPEYTSFKKHINKYIGIEIYYDTIENEFCGGVGTWLLLIDRQEYIDTIQIAYNNLKADLQELKEIKNGNEQVF